LFGIRVANFWHWHKTFANCTLDWKERKFYSSRSGQFSTDLLCSGLSTGPPATSTTGLNTPFRYDPFQYDLIRSVDPSAMSGGGTASPFYEQVTLVSDHQLQALPSRQKTSLARPPPISTPLVTSNSVSDWGEPVPADGNAN